MEVPLRKRQTSSRHLASASFPGMEIMEITVARAAFLDLLETVNQAAPNKPVLPILQNVYFKMKDGTLLLSATDLEIFISKKMAVESKEEVTTTIPASIITELVKALPDETVRMEFWPSEVLISGEHFKHKVKTVPADDYPYLEFTSEAVVTVPVEEFQSAVQQTAFAASTDPVAVSLRGVNFLYEDGQLVLSAVNGFHYSIRKTDSTSALTDVFNETVPAASLNTIAKLLKGEIIKIGVDGNKLIFTGDNVVCGCMILDGAFPGYKEWPVSNGAIAVFSVLQLVSAVKQARVFLSDKRVLRIKFGPMFAKMSTDDGGYGEGSVDIPVEYKEGTSEIEIGFNADYLLDLLSVIGNGRVLLVIEASTKPGIFSIEGDGKFVHGIMPMV